MNEYLAALFRRHEKHMFSAGGDTFEGIIDDVDESGRLRIKVKDSVRTFGIKEIQYV